MISELRPYQLQALADIRDSVRSGVKRLVVQAATGAGKTKLAAAIVEGAREKRNRVAFVCPAISLIDQTVESFYAEGIHDIGVVQSNHEMTDGTQPVQVCSIQTVQRRGFPHANVVIFDEIHRLHDAHKTWIKHPDWQTVPMIGLSATPWTKGLGKYFDSLLIAATTQELIEQGYLSPFRVFSTGHPDLSGVKIVAGDYQENQLSAAMQGGELTADIIRTWQEKWGKDKTLCFGVDKAHAKSIQERFEHAGISCGYQDAETTADERREIKRKFHNGEYQVVSNIQTLTTGVDWDVRCLILARPTRSEMLFVQIIGRALRTAPGKLEALILDHSDSTAKLGFVTDIHHEHLDSGKANTKAAPQERKEPLPKECESCAYLMPPRVPICPNCGHQRKPVCSIMEQDGELVEIVPGQLGKIGKKKEWTYQEKHVFLAELKGYALEHNYKSGWPAMKFKEKFGEFPPRYMDKIEPAKAISPGVALWIRSRNIAWHKSRAKQNATVEHSVNTDEQ
jgi:superfamily II DNA or RNA helicase